MEKLVFVTFSWVNYLVFRHNEPLNFLVYESVILRLPKELVVSSTLHHCLALLPSTFSQGCTDFDKEKFAHFWALPKRKGHPGKKVVNGRNIMFYVYGEIQPPCIFRTWKKILSTRGVLEQGQLLIITWMWSEPLTLITQKRNNLRHWNFYCNLFK